MHRHRDQHEHDTREKGEGEYEGTQDENATDGAECKKTGDGDGDDVHNGVRFDDYVQDDDEGIRDDDDSHTMRLMGIGMVDSGTCAVCHANGRVVSCGVCGRKVHVSCLSRENSTTCLTCDIRVGAAAGDFGEEENAATQLSSQAVSQAIVGERLSSLLATPSS